MTLARRRFLCLATSATALCMGPRRARAQSYPARPIRIIVPVSAGGATDILARLLAQWLTDRMGQSFVVENRPGAGGNLGTELAVRAAPDGYTLLLIQAGNVINASLYGNLSFNFQHDIAPVAIINRPPFLMAVHPSVPAKTVAEFVAYANANPGKINMASAGVGTGNHVAGELFKMLTGVQMLHVPYRGGGPALIDLVAGQVQIMFGGMPSMIQYVRAGTLRPLAVTTRVRSDVLPELPTVGETVPGYEASDFYGLGVPKDTPPDIIARLNQETNAWLNEPEIRMRLADLGGMTTGGTPAVAARLISEETEKWAKVVEFAGAKAQ
jgi:tripartite-type tricarboxylate transporter receptor subunit TctC